MDDSSDFMLVFFVERSNTPSPIIFAREKTLYLWQIKRNKQAMAQNLFKNQPLVTLLTVHSEQPFDCSSITVFYSRMPTWYFGKVGMM